MSTWLVWLVSKDSEHVYICLRTLNPRAHMVPQHQKYSHVYRHRAEVVEIYVHKRGRAGQKNAVREDDFNEDQKTMGPGHTYVSWLSPKSSNMTETREDHTAGGAICRAMQVQICPSMRDDDQSSDTHLNTAPLYRIYHRNACLK